jgi:hypothetical protein
MSIQLVPSFRLDVDLAPPVEVGPTYVGMRRIIPITGGKFYGKDIEGEVLPGGADWNVVRPDGVVHLWARYTIKTDDGAIIMITNEGFQQGPPDTMERILSGKPFDSSKWYARTRPVFEVSHPKYDWLNKYVFVGDVLVPTSPVQVSIQLYQVL